MDNKLVYSPSTEDKEDISEVLNAFIDGRNILNRGYNYFNGRSLRDVIDDWTKRWNGYIPPMNPLLDATQSNIFIQFTRNAIISYLAKAAMTPVKAKIIAVAKKSGLLNQKFADVLKDLNQYSLNAENAEKKFLMAAMENCVKGTVVVYEGYAKHEQKMKSPIQFNAVTGELEWKEETRVLFDNCYQEIVSLEDFYITNPFEPDVQKQPKVIWRKLTSYSEAKAEFDHYKNFKYVTPGSYQLSEVHTFYKDMSTDLQKDQVEILRYYCRMENEHIILVNGVVIYSGPIPFKDGKYPFAKAVNEPFGVDFFWGNGHPNKYMGEQDLINTFINAMADKTINSLLPTGISSDLDDLIEDDSLEAGKFRKVGDIEKWKWLEPPAVTPGEINMFQQIMGLARESGASDAGSAVTPRGGKLQTRQVLLKQQELMSKLSFNMTFLEDLERDRTELRLSHILQFYSIGRIEKITGVKGKEVEKLAYRDVYLNDVKLSDGRKGNKIIKLIGDEYKNADQRAQMEEDMSVQEIMGEMNGTPTEVMAVSVDTFEDFNHSVQVIKYSSFEKNQAIDQASRMEFGNWRFGLAQMVPIGNPQGLIEWVEEPFDIDTSQFETSSTPQTPGMDMMQQANPVQAGGSGKPQVLSQNTPSSVQGNALASLT